ncbi:alpha-hydroxy-acid oxidizing protein [Paraburkholderia dipogonis]|uniref:Alpha-hydroxy-acid oxidizing protein n=1 Tax=Paraburkholderia dipogonis TaxID=1211383 RepID=A0ABW9B6W7_9BURK
MKKLDTAPSTIRALPSIVDAAGNHAHVWLNGGIGSGQDVLRAKATLIGCPFLYRLGAMEQEGVVKAIDIMAFCGRTNVLDIGRDIIHTDDPSRRPLDSGSPLPD